MRLAPNSPSSPPTHCAVSFPLGRELGNPDSQLNIYIHLMVAVLFPIVFLVVSVYDVRRDVRPVGDARALFVAVSTATLALAGALYFSYRDVPRLLVFYFYFLIY